MKKSITLFAILAFLMAGNFSQAQSFPDNWKEFDLSKYGMGFTMYAPASATFDWDGDSEELYINAEEDNFRMMISIWEESVQELVEEYKEEVEEGGDVDFIGYIHDTENGFLAKESIEGDIDFEVYYAFKKGSQTFFFQTNPLMDGLYSESAGENMFQACKLAAGL